MEPSPSIHRIFNHIVFRIMERVEKHLHIHRCVRIMRYGDLKERTCSSIPHTPRGIVVKMRMFSSSFAEKVAVDEALFLFRKSNGPMPTITSFHSVIGCSERADKRVLEPSPPYSTNFRLNLTATVPPGTASKR